ncbi:MAG: Phosphodiesterase YfcE [Sodalis sp.]|uniref:hypothetical protein n=1 Tax=Sodalis sp. (in: enterobacteria) TaxID=1898979 RepID=UPI0038737913|nr:MAG: Phosphodiesterase YfcE [Sodalis sp.]
MELMIVSKVAAALNAYFRRIITVRGNCDSEFPFSAPWAQVLLGETRQLFH